MRNVLLALTVALLAGAILLTVRSIRRDADVGEDESQMNDGEVYDQAQAYTEQP